MVRMVYLVVALSVWTGTASGSSLVEQERQPFSLRWLRWSEKVNRAYAKDGRLRSPREIISSAIRSYDLRVGQQVADTVPSDDKILDAFYQWLMEVAFGGTSSLGKKEVIGQLARVARLTTTESQPFVYRYGDYRFLELSKLFPNGELAPVDSYNVALRERAAGEVPEFQVADEHLVDSPEPWRDETEVNAYQAIVKRNSLIRRGCPPCWTAGSVQPGMGCPPYRPREVLKASLTLASVAWLRDATPLGRPADALEGKITRSQNVVSEFYSWFTAGYGGNLSAATVVDQFYRLTQVPLGQARKRYFPADALSLPLLFPLGSLDLGITEFEPKRVTQTKSRESLAQKRAAAAQIRDQKNNPQPSSPDPAVGGAWYDKDMVWPSDDDQVITGEFGSGDSDEEGGYMFVEAGLGDFSEPDDPSDTEL